MRCIVCDRKINASHQLKIWIENDKGMLVKISNSKPYEVYICACYSNRRNVCKEALNQGRQYLNDDAVLSRCSKTGKITEVVN